MKLLANRSCARCGAKSCAHKPHPIPKPPDTFTAPKINAQPVTRWNVPAPAPIFTANVAPEEAAVADALREALEDASAAAWRRTMPPAGDVPPPPPSVFGGLPDRDAPAPPPDDPWARLQPHPRVTTT